MKIRKSTLDDLDRMQEIYVHARNFMKEHGNPNQWGPNSWPPEALLRQDIRDGHSYVCVDDGGWMTVRTASCTGSLQTGLRKASALSA